MAGVRSGTSWVDLGRLFGHGTVTGLTDWQLLHRFLDVRDEAAFEALVAQHGAMVLGVCRRILDNAEDIEDAFQATFLVLVRKGHSLRPSDAVGNWLHGVAHRVALRARAQGLRRKTRERSAEDLEPVDSRGESSRDPLWFDLKPVLDEELRRLPATYRVAVVLCFLEGQTHEEAAQQLGWPLGTVKGRLARAKDLLRGRLTRRGLAMTSVGVAALFEREARASVPAGLIKATIKAATRVAAGEATAGIVPAATTVLAEGVLWTMRLTQLKMAASVLALLGAIAAGAGALAQSGGKGPEPAPTRAQGDVLDKKTNDTAPAEAVKNAEAVKGSSNPAENKAEPRAADYGEAFKTALDLYRAGELEIGKVIEWSQRLLSIDPDDKFQSGSRHIQRMQMIEAVAINRQQARPDNSLGLDRLAARFHREQAERDFREMELFFTKNAATDPRAAKLPAIDFEAKRDPLSFTEASTRASSASTPGPGGTVPGPQKGQDARSLAILKKLDESIAMNFPNETPLEEVLKYIKAATAGPNEQCIAIYVDPIGLQEAEKTMTSPVTCDLEGVPLKRTLQLMLKQIGLCYMVQDGMLYITAQSSEDNPLPDPMYQPSPFMMMQLKHERGEMSAAERTEFIQMLKDRIEIERLLKERDSTTSQSDQDQKMRRRKELLELLKENKELNELLRTDPSKAFEELMKRGRGGFQ